VIASSGKKGKSPIQETLCTGTDINSKRRKEIEVSKVEDKPITRKEIELP